VYYNGLFQQIDMPTKEEIIAITDEAIDKVLSMPPKFSKLLSSQESIGPRLGVTSQFDFYLGIMYCLIILTVDYEIMKKHANVDNEEISITNSNF